jgi:hypothetical protein
MISFSLSVNVERALSISLARDLLTNDNGTYNNTYYQIKNELNGKSNIENKKSFENEEEDIIEVLKDNEVDKKLAKKDDSSTPLRVIDSDSKDDKITKIGKDRILTGFIPGTMGKAGKLPSHNCKTKGKLVMFITVDKAGNGAQIS